MTGPVGDPATLSPLALAHERLCTGVEAAAIEGLRVFRRPGAALFPPAVYVPPPVVTWDVYDAEPTSAQFEVILAVAADERAVARLFELLPLVVAALEFSQAEAVVRKAEPDVWRVGTTELPCYAIVTDVGLAGG